MEPAGDDNVNKREGEGRGDKGTDEKVALSA
jgi:hypothetical protein